MGVILNGQLMDMPILNGVKMNAYLNGQLIWSKAPVVETKDVITLETVPGTDSVSFTINSVANAENQTISVDWGDGNKEDFVTDGVIAEHTYTDPSVAHTIKIKG